MIPFLTIWLGQTVSLLGSNLTNFALGVWVYRRTGMATPFALTLVCATLPVVVLAPLAGSLVDRWDRRKVMILSDAGAGLSTLAVALLILSGRLEVWHVYLVTAASSSFGAFQWPAYTAAVPRLLPREHLGRGNGLIQLGQALSRIAAPALAGVLLLAIGLEGVALIDVGTFLFAIATLMLIRIPGAAKAGEKAGNAGALHGDRVGFGYFRERPGLLALLVFLCVSNFLTGAVSALAPPLVLSSSSPRVLGTIQTVGGVGMLAGSLVMSAWGGPRRRIL
ncbi:MAG TPA: MFS transporter, partial [Thermoanaerobaculia bacterium]|nr:MFS transporter [Thermoanaerobaculia bacterium]